MQYQYLIYQIHYHILYIILYIILLMFYWKMMGPVCFESFPVFSDLRPCPSIPAKGPFQFFDGSADPRGPRELEFTRQPS